MRRTSCRAAQLKGTVYVYVLVSDERNCKSNARKPAAWFGAFWMSANLQKWELYFHTQRTKYPRLVGLFREKTHFARTHTRSCQLTAAPPLSLSHSCCASFVLFTEKESLALRKMATILRTAVSRKKRRYVKDGYDLDLACSFCLFVLVGFRPFRCFVLFFFAGIFAPNVSGIHLYCHSYASCLREKILPFNGPFKLSQSFEWRASAIPQT
jgi:hypothetical protein